VPYAGRCRAVPKFLPYIAGNHRLGDHPDFETAGPIAIALTQRRVG
jgi:hypothetical protein